MLTYGLASLALVSGGCPPIQDSAEYEAKKSLQELKRLAEESKPLTDELDDQIKKTEEEAKKTENQNKTLVEKLNLPLDEEIKELVDYVKNNPDQHEKRTAPKSVYSPGGESELFIKNFKLNGLPTTVEYSPDYNRLILMVGDLGSGVRFVDHNLDGFLKPHENDSYLKSLDFKMYTEGHLPPSVRNRIQWSQEQAENVHKNYGQAVRDIRKEIRQNQRK